ncbi:MAG: LysM peptidoglycan-binding domain-containing protein [Clostridiales bacterium]|nr:LysM peptidoglycan-binding domain-containing protein [Clostridiales bacterium]
MSIKKIPFPFYQVKKGENLKIISQKFQIDSTKILLDNNLSPKQVKEGCFLILKK